MKLALECPTSMLGVIQPLADFDWILAHLVLSDPDYAEYYKQSGRFKVLDNSVNELLEPLSIGEIAAAAKCVHPDLVVAPDYLGDKEKTLESLEMAIITFSKESIMPVVQGSDLDEVLSLLGEILNLGFERIAVPYDILSSRESSSVIMASNRTKVVHLIESRVPIGFGIHLLGMTTLPELLCYNSGWVKSIDTGVPVLLGSKGYAIDKASIDKSKPTMSQMGELHLETAYLGSIYYNIAYLRKVLND